MRSMRRVGLTLLVLALACTSACTSGVLAEGDTTASPPEAAEAAETAAESPAASSEGPATPTAADDGDESASEPESQVESVGQACSDEDSGYVTSPPALLAELSVPFYPCVKEMTAMPGSDPLFVGEYDTDHEMIIVEMEIVNQFDASDWIVTERTVEGDNAITHAQKPGYELVVVIGPSRTDAAAASVHYTLREQ
ncbi:MAG: hypothetical protein ACTJGQ_11055 [Agrococcus casei]|uniref:hypothetical protein n=2 Tax=Agrococcus casei TaxID=343512 RepID=UPI000B355576|nr:hypothetical protein [Agrococcus casei]